MTDPGTRIHYEFERCHEAVVIRLELRPCWAQFGPPDGCELRGGRLVCS